ncbi:MAG TPA: GntR family transcriptional regulator [Bryobacteraceae bacterium]|jgi:DNA-binding GntR family transcriptional regulator|nr:GntR family transcriptional regulator [Bryobacteraceae bacterium]
MAFPAVGRTKDTENLADQAYFAIRDKILRGVLRLGAPVSSRSLAQELGMSHLPVSQALRKLEGEGFLESRPRAGTRVRVPTEQDVIDRYEVREALETQAARLFAAKASARQRREMLRMGGQLDALFKRAASGVHDSEFLYAVHSYHLDLHMKIAEYAGCKALRDLIERNHILTFNWFYDVATHRDALPPRFHTDLMESLVSGDVSEADRAMRAHIGYGREERIRRIQLEAPTEWRERRVQEGADAKQNPKSLPARTRRSAFGR